MNLGMLLDRNARYLGGKTALVFEGQRPTFAELDRLVNRAANALCAAGIRKGDKLATFLPNSLELYLLYWAAAKTGAVSVPLSTLLRGSGLASLLSDSESALLVASPELAETVEAAGSQLSIPTERRFLTGDVRRAGWTAGGTYSRLVRTLPRRTPAFYPATRTTSSIAAARPACPRASS